MSGGSVCDEPLLNPFSALPVQVDRSAGTVWTGLRCRGEC